MAHPSNAGVGHSPLLPSASVSLPPPLMLPPLGSMHTTDGAVELLLSPLSHTGERSVSFITSAGPILLGKKAAAVLLSPRVLHYERVERITAERERSGVLSSSAGLFGLHKMEQDKRYIMSGVRLSIPITTNH